MKGSDGGDREQGRRASADYAATSDLQRAGIVKLTIPKKGISTRMVQKIVKRWAEYSRLGDLSPHDLRGTAITRALDGGLSYRQVQMMSKHRDSKTVMRYDHGRENLEQSAVNFLAYDE